MKSLLNSRPIRHGLKDNSANTLKCWWFDWGGEFQSNEQKTYMAENGIEYQMSMPDSLQQNGWVERFQSNGFWIYAVKAKLHTYNVTLIKRADYKTLVQWKTEHLTPSSLCSGEIVFPIGGPIPLCSDNQAVIFLTVNPAVECQTKHINIQHHYIWEQYENKVVEPFHISGVNNSADLLTKSLPIITVEQFRSKIRLS